MEVVLETGQASVSMLQRRLKLGYARAARLVDQLEEKGIVGPFEGSKPRQLLITKEQWQEIQYRQGIVSPAPAQPEAAPEPTSSNPLAAALEAVFNGERPQEPEGERPRGEGEGRRRRRRGGRSEGATGGESRSQGEGQPR